MVEKKLLLIVYRKHKECPFTVREYWCTEMFTIEKSIGAIDRIHDLKIGKTKQAQKINILKNINKNKLQKA